MPSPEEGCRYPEIIDDLYICAVYAPNDGPGGVLATAGTRFIRELNATVNPGLTVTGSMIFDPVDIDRLQQFGGLANIILHEMGHILGK